MKTIKHPLFLAVLASAVVTVTCGGVADVHSPNTGDGGTGDGGTGVDAAPPPVGADGALDDASTTEASVSDDGGTSGAADATEDVASGATDATDDVRSTSAPDGAGPDAGTPQDAGPDSDAAPPFDAGGTAYPTLDAGGCLISPSAWTAAPPALPPLPPEIAPSTDSLINVALTVNDILYDPYTRLLYASVPSSFGANGNSIARIDPTTGTILGTVYVGSEPGALAESADGQFLYVGLNGAAAMRRYVLATQTPELQFPLVQPLYNFGAVRALSIRVLPNSPHSVLVASGPALQDEGSVAIYDDGAPRTKVLQSNAYASVVVTTGSDSLALEPNGFQLESLSVLCLDQAGVSIASTIQPALGSGPSFLTYPDSYAYAGGLLYYPGGQVLDPLGGGAAGTYGTAGPFVLEASVDRAYFLTAGVVNGAGGAELIAYDQAHFTSAGQTVLAGDDEDTRVRLVRWGRYGFAFASNSGARVSIVRTSIVPPQP